MIEKNYYEINYEIESVCDMDGTFPLSCAASLFDLLQINSNILIQNHYVHNDKRDEILKKLSDRYNCKFHAFPPSPKHFYCFWINSLFSSNSEFTEVLDLQALFMNYIALTPDFDWGQLISSEIKDTRYYLSKNQAKCGCDIVDQARNLTLFFHLDYYNLNDIQIILSDWEKRIGLKSDTQRQELFCRKKGESIPLIRLTI